MSFADGRCLVFAAVSHVLSLLTRSRACRHACVVLSTYIAKGCLAFVDKYPGPWGGRLRRKRQSGIKILEDLSARQGEQPQRIVTAVETRVSLLAVMRGMVMFPFSAHNPRKERRTPASAKIRNAGAICNLNLLTMKKGGARVRKLEKPRQTKRDDRQPLDS